MSASYKYCYFRLIKQKGRAYSKLCHSSSKLVYDEQLKENEFKRKQEWPYNARMNPEKFACFIENGPTSASEKDDIK